MDIDHKGITYDELASSYKDVTIIDVRNRNEIENQGQIPGAHCIPVTEIKLACGLDPNSFRERYGFDKPDCNDDLVVCCKSGIRSKTACDLLQSKGYTRHRIYRGSFSEWEEKGGEVLKPGQPYEYHFEDSTDEEDNTTSKEEDILNSNTMKEDLLTSNTISSQQSPIASSQPTTTQQRVK